MSDAGDMPSSEIGSEDSRASQVESDYWPDEAVGSGTELASARSAYPAIEINPDSQIRVLSLFPGELQHGLFGELEVQQLLTNQQAPSSPGDVQDPSPVRRAADNQLPYEALSYAWGSWDEPRSIGISGCPRSIPITSNLWRALRRLRYPDRSRRLWIDQICINLWGLYERNQQLQLMGKIYQQADQVTVWLGDVADDGDGLPHAPISSVEHVATSLGETSPDQDDTLPLLRQALHDTKPRWWDRLWVVQEVAMATQQPQFAYGRCMMPWNAMTTLTATCSPGSLIDQFIAATKRFLALQRTTGRFHGVMDMIDIITSTACSEELDKVYALLHLIPPRERLMIEPNYHKSASTVFAEATFASIIANESYSIMDLKLAAPDSRASGASWAFDFATACAVSADDHALNPQAIQWMRRADCNKLRAHLDPNSLTLRLHAFELGQIALSVRRKAHSPAAYSTEEVLRMRRTLQESATAVVGTSPYNMLSSAEQLPDDWLARVSDSLDSLDGIVDSSLSIPEILLQEYLKSIAQQEKNDRSFWRKLRDILHRLLGRRTLRKSPAGDLPRPERNPAFAIFDDPCPLPRDWPAYMSKMADEAGFFLSESAFVVSAPVVLEQGDVVTLPFGGHAPMILRRASENTYRFVCMAYVHGVSEGELARKVPDLELHEVEYDLV